MQWSDRHSFFLAVVCYGLSTIYSLLVFRKGFRRDNWINYGLLAFGCAWHTAAMFQRGFSLERCPINNLYEATLFIGWTIVGTYLLIGAWPRLQFLGAFVSPLLLALGVFALMPALDVQGPRPTFTGGWSSLHKALILLAYGAFGVGCVGGLMYLTREHQLKRDKAHALWSRLPPIQRLEVTISQSLITGFVLLTAGLAAGAVYLKQSRNVFFSGDALVVYSLAVWLWYLLLLVARWCYAQRGRRFAWGAIGSFIFVMLTFWGVYLLSGLHHS
jgi:ABC-type uncharacterized transport system permease subunit